MADAALDELDRRFIDRALSLAEKGLYTTDPNPRVGCVIARGENILGQGYHVAAGRDHAEVMALREAGAAAQGATAYVTLEPCSHHGRTPPCARALIAAGISRAVVSTLDPFEEVNGSGVAAMKSAGIEVCVGAGESTARQLNCGYFSRLESGRPWVRLKLAMSLDGRTALANGASQWITGPEARTDVHKLRGRASAILSSATTVLADRARLNARIEGTEIQQPCRVVLDSRFRLPADAPCLAIDSPLLVVGGATQPPTWMMDANIEAIQVPADPAGRPLLPALMQELARREINEVHVEAGATLSGALIEAGLVDELIVYVAPDLLGPDARALVSLQKLQALSERTRFEFGQPVRLGRDLRLDLRPVVKS